MPMTFTKFGLALASLAFSATAVFAQQPAFKPAIVYDLGGKFDKSFNEGVYAGAETFKKETGVEYRDFEPQNDAQREQALRRFARDGFSPIVEVGFVGGMDIPLIRKFACGYVQGVKFARKDGEVFQNMTGTTGAAWNDPVKGGELAKSQIDRGADVIYHAAGGTGVGVMRAAADAGKLGIGVDSNQNSMHPGKVLTSMVKRVDVATYTAFDQAKKGTFKAGVSVLGLAEDGVAWALDDNNKSLVTAEMKAAADKAAADIKSGTIK